MCALRLGDEPDSLSGGMQADAKIDIVNRRGLIKSVKSPERIGTHDPQTGPECRRLKIAVAMDPVMAQIGVERRKAPHARSVVIAAEGGCNLWSRLQRSHKSAESLLFDDHIRVNESEDISGGLSRRQIARPHGVAHPRGAYPLAIVGDDRYRISFCKFADPGVKSVVEDDDLISPAKRAHQSINASRQRRHRVASGHYDSDPRFRFHVLKRPSHALMALTASL